MTIPLPFTTSFPLKSSPFSSRVESQLNSAKNYYLLAFKPGFPLQAAELNEMQEIFFMQQTLTQTMFANWGVKKYRDMPGGEGELLPTPWNGCTPLHPNLVQIEYNIPAVTITKATFKSGWYLLKSDTFNSGFGVWVYNPSDTVFLQNYTLTSPSTLDGNYGIKVKVVTVNCTKTSPPGENEDITLQDSSNVNAINGPCGAARIKIQITGFGNTTSSPDEVLLPIISVNKVGGVDLGVSYMNTFPYPLLY